MQMLTRYDDYPVHQTAELLAHMATSDRNVYARYWFNGYDPSGEFYFGVALGLYPHREVADCAVSIVRRDGVQTSFHASRRLRGDRTDLSVGPFTLQILEPMRVLRVIVDKNETGFTADLTFHATTPAHTEPMDHKRNGVRKVMEMTRFSQFGEWEGFIFDGERRLDVDPATTKGLRDRSWGFRGVGEPEPGISHLVPSQMFWLWAPLQWKDRCTHYGLHEYANGERWKEFAHIYPLYPADGDFDPVGQDGFRHIRPGQHRLTFQRGSRLLGPSEIDLIDGERVAAIKLEPLLRFHMKGLGYFHDKWGHGFYQGEEALFLERWNINEIDVNSPSFRHVHHVVRATSGDEVGHGTLEQFLLGPNDRYRLTGFLDPAPATGSAG
jgi:hypothetical protein